MGQKWLDYLKKHVGDDGNIEELEVKIEYRDGSKRKWIFASGQEPVLEEDDDDDEDEDDDDEDQ
jgi:hypothetical protein